MHIQISPWLTAFAIATLALTSCGPNPPAENCDNGGFENGNTDNWIGWTGTYQNPKKDQGLDPDRHRIMSASDGWDPQVGGNLLPVVSGSGGNHSIRLGNSVPNSLGEALRYDFTVDNNTETFRFRYAVVLEDLGHHEDDQPFFSYRLVRKRWFGNQTIEEFRVHADRDNPYFEISPNDSDIVYKNWTCVSINLSDYVGDKFYIEFITKDCNLDWHFGYAYIDMVCATQEAASANPVIQIEETSICQGAPVIADGSQSTGETRHYWSVASVDASGNFAGQYKGEWFVGTAGSFDVGAFWQSHGYQLECGRYYSIKLAVANDCNGWTETSQIIQIECPPGVPASPDKHLCYDNGQTAVVIGPTPQPGYTYNWTPTTGLSDPTVAQPVASPTTTTTYTLKVQAPNGAGPCLVAQDWVTVHVSRKFGVGIVTQRRNACGGAILHAIPNQDDNYTFEWSTGATTSSISVSPTTTANYMVTVSNQCYSIVESITLNPHPFQNLSYTMPTAFSPNGDGNNDTLRLIDVNALPMGTTPAYGAYQYKLEIYNRWGQLVHESSDLTYTGFTNGEIQWDGTASVSFTPNWWQANILGQQAFSNGQIVTRDVYIYVLIMRSCNNTETTRGEITLVI